MLAKFAIEESIPYLKLTDEIGFALDLMEEYKQEHLPVVKGKKLIGVVSEQQLLDATEEKTLADFKFPFTKIAVNENAHIFDAMKAGYECNSSVLPVVDDKENYKGLISPKSLLIKLSEFNFASEIGGIFVIELNANDYSLAEIARLVESNNASILSIATAKLDDINKIQVTVKVNTLDLTYIIATLERYEYNITYIFQHTEQLDDLKERYNELMNYMDM